MEVPVWFAWIFDILIIVVILLVLLFIQAWQNVKNTEGRMIAEVWEPSGFPVRHLVKINETGKTVEVDGITYCLPREPSQEEMKTATRHIYPSRRYVLYPSKPFMGLKFLQVTLRIESWEKDNPEPIRPFYGRVEKDGKFIDSQLTVTGMEWSAAKREIQATSLAMSIQENEARQKELTRALARLPNNVIVYVGLAISSLASILCVILIYQVAAK